MVDNINVNRISPLLSSTERVKRVDRRQRDQEHPPFKGDLKDEEKKKKKKKKKKSEEESPSDIRYARDSSPQHVGAVEKDNKKEKRSTPDQNKKIIDIRV